MKNIGVWKQSAERRSVGSPAGLKVQKAFFALLDYIHREDWKGACHASSTVFYSLLAAQGVESEICLGEASFGKICFDHSWVVISGEIYDVAISNTLIANVYFPPVFRGLDLSTTQPTVLRYGVQSGEGFDGNAKWVRSLSVSDYMSRFPGHPQGLFGITKLVAKAAGIRVNIASVEKCAARASWKECS